MRKLIIIAIIAIGILAFPLASSAATNVKVSLPGYKCIINNSTVYYLASQYPLLTYNDVTYFPMTWNYCKSMDLVTEWVEGDGLYIASKPCSSHTGLVVTPLQKGYYNKLYMTASVAEYPVYIDGDPAPADSAYPILNFRGVTYFPMTWSYAHDMFGWTLDYKGWLFAINTKPEYKSCIITPSVEKNGIYYLKNVNNFDDGKLYYLEYKTGKTTSEALTEKNRIAHFTSKDKVKDVSENLSIKEKSIYYKKTVLCEFDALVKGLAKSGDVNISASETTSNGVTYLTVNAYYQLYIPAPYTPVEVYTFIKQGSKYRLVAKNSVVQKVGKAGKYYYFEVRERSGFKGTTFNCSIVYKVDSSGNVEKLNDSKVFADYNSITLIGIANNKAYFKCVWAPEAKNPLIGSDNEEYLSVAPVNDGFFTFDGSKLKQLHKYVFSSDEFVNTKGNIYISNDYTGVLKKVC